MMNLGRWDEARESLEKARKLAPKAITFITPWLLSIASPVKPIPPWPILKSPSTSALPTASMPVTMEISPSFRKIPASPNCSILEKKATELIFSRAIHRGI